MSEGARRHATAVERGESVRLLRDDRGPARGSLRGARTRVSRLAARGGNEEDATLYDLSSGKATHLAEVFWGYGASTVDGLDFLALDSSGFAAWRETSKPIPDGLTALSCPSASLCVAGDVAGNILTSSDPLGGPDAWSRVGVLGDRVFWGVGFGGCRRT